MWLCHVCIRKKTGDIEVIPMVKPFNICLVVAPPIVYVREEQEEQVSRRDNSRAVFFFLMVLCCIDIHSFKFESDEKF